MFKSWIDTINGVRSLLVLGASIGIAGCGAEGMEFGEEGMEAELAEETSTPEVEQLQEALNGGWTNLVLKNGWKKAANANTPAVGIVNGIVTFRGALDGTAATSNIAFCLSTPAFNNFQPTDAGYMTLRAALANGATGSLTIDFPFSPQIPGSSHYCVSVSEHGASSQPGANAKAMTSLEGVTFDKTFSNSVKLDAEPAWESFGSYPQRGSDGNSHPDGQGVFAKLVNGFVRFQAVMVAPDNSPFTLFSLPNNMKPGNPVFIPVTLCPLYGPQHGRLVVQTDGKVRVEGPSTSAWCGVSLDGASYSMAPLGNAKSIPLSGSWVSYSPRAVRARDDGGAVRLEGAVKNGTTSTIGTLPSGLRPAKLIYVVANSPYLAQPATLSISSGGVIKVVSPPMVVASQGISLDGVSFGL